MRTVDLERRRTLHFGRLDFVPERHGTVVFPVVGGKKTLGRKIIEDFWDDRGFLEASRVD